MKVIKRDGRAVEYNSDKIRIAIGKANKEVLECNRASDKQIENIIKYIESLDKKRMLVEDIQDIIETKLMEQKRFVLAKKYIIYRYNRALVRKSNTTDESILSLIKNNSFDSASFSNEISDKRDLITNEVSIDLAKRVLLPENVTKAHDSGIIYFHDMNSFIQPIVNASLINISDMLDNGTVINGKLIESPKTFLVACIVTTQIISTLISSQAGGISIDVSALSKYLKKSYDKFYKSLKEKYKNKISDSLIESITLDKVNEELKSGIQIINYQVNTIMTNIKDKALSITVFLNINGDLNCIHETSLIIEEILKQAKRGVKVEDGSYVTPKCPKFVYVLDSNNMKDQEYGYLTELALDCAKEKQIPRFMSAKRMKEDFDGNVFSPIGDNLFLPLYKDDGYKFFGRFSQGIVSINLVNLALSSFNDLDKFFTLFDERLELCKEALMCKYFSLLGTCSDISSLHWQNGGLARLSKNERIDKYLKNGYSFLNLGFAGLYEVTEILNIADKEIFIEKILNLINSKCKEWSKDTGVLFKSCFMDNIDTLNYLVLKDREEFGIIKGITDKDYYDISFDKKSGLDKLLFEENIAKLTKGGFKSYINNDLINFDMIEFIYDKIRYIEIGEV